MPKATETSTSKDRPHTPQEATMANKAEQTPGRAETTPEIPIPEMAEFNNDVFRAYLNTSRAILESAAALNQEMVRFAGERFQADLEAIQALPGYTNVQGVVSFQSDFMRKAAEAYQTEFSKLMQQSTDAVSTAFEPLIETVENSTRKGAGK